MSFRDLDRPPLDAAALRSALVGPRTLWTDVVVTSSTGSTNADAAAAARAGAPEGAVHVTDVQTAGRGRLDRAWSSPAGSGVIVSVVLRPDAVPAASPGAGSAATEASEVGVAPGAAASGVRAADGAVPAVPHADIEPARLLVRASTGPAPR